MAASNTVGKSRERLKAILDNTTGGSLTLSSTRVKLGVVNQAGSDEFFNDIVSAGPMCVIGPANWGDANLQQKWFTFEVVAKLWIGFAADADYDYVAAEDLVAELLKEMTNTALYVDGATPINGIEIERDDEIRLKPKIILYTFRLKYVGAD